MEACPVIACATTYILLSNTQRGFELKTSKLSKTDLGFH